MVFLDSCLYSRREISIARLAMKASKHMDSSIASKIFHLQTSWKSPEKWWVLKFSLEIGCTGTSCSPGRPLPCQLYLRKTTATISRFFLQTVAEHSWLHPAQFMANLKFKVERWLKNCYSTNVKTFHSGGSRRVHSEDENDNEISGYRQAAADTARAGAIEYSTVNWPSLTLHRKKQTSDWRITLV